MARARPAKASASTVTAEMAVAQGFQTIAASCIAHLEANERALTERRDSEALHQSRVAIRRLRACFSAFERILRKRPVTKARRKLKQVFQVFGRCRDLDVFLAGHGRAANGAGSADLWAARDEAYDGAVRLVEADTYRMMIADMAAAIDDDAWLKRGRRAVTLEESPLVDFARRQLDERLSSVTERGRKFERLNAKKRHRLRIAVKELRYAAEFFAVLFDGEKPAKRRKAFLTALEELQDRLGVLNDIAVAETITHKMGGKNGAANGTATKPRPDRKFVSAQTTAAARALKTLKQPHPFWNT